MVTDWHLKVKASLDGRVGAVHSRPVAHYEAIKPPLLAQDVSE